MGRRVRHGKEMLPEIWSMINWVISENQSLLQEQPPTSMRVWCQCEQES